MTSKPIDLSPDDLLAQATCAVLIDGKIQGTAWLVSDEGHLLTAGHILGTSKPIDKVEVVFSEDVPREAYKIQWGYNRDMGVDFAVLKLVHPVTDRYPLPLNLKDEVAGRLRSCGYGKTLKDQSVGRGEFLGFFDPQNSPSNRLFQLRSPELGEGGYSGAAVFSDDLQAVVAVQIEATTATTGPGRDTVLAMPLYRIARDWEPLLQIEIESRVRYPADILNARSMLASLPIPPMYAHPQPPEMHWANRVQEISTLTELWKSEQVRIIGLIGLGGVGKSTLARRWCDQLPEQTPKSDGFFWWSFYYQPSLDEFLEGVLGYLTGGQFESSEVPSPWAKIQQLVALLRCGRFVIVLDGLEVMQKTEEAGDHFGRLEDIAFRNLLGLVADPTLHRSLILITSRFPLTDLKSLDGFSYRSFEVDVFSGNDGVEFLKCRGITGKMTDLYSLSNEYGGHALSLSLLAGYLNEYFDGQSQGAWEIPYIATTETTKVYQMLQAYNNRLTEPQQAFMQLLSAFRRPVTHKTLETIVRNEEFIQDNPLLKSLSAFKSFELRGLVSNLENGALVSRDKNDLGEWSYTTHLIVREYFYKQLADNPELNLKVNLQLRDYASSLPIPDSPEDLEDLMPLYDSVFYSCRAGLLDEAARIHRESMSMGTQGNWAMAYQFGAYEFQKSFLREFFPERDLTRPPQVTDSASKIFLLLEMGSCSNQMGQPAEAKSFYERAAELAVNSSDYLNAAIAHCELAWAKSHLGELNDAEVIINKAIEFSRLSKTDLWEINSRAGLGWIAFLRGEIDLAELAYKDLFTFVKNAKPAAHVINAIKELEFEEEPDFVNDLGIEYATYLLATGDIDESFEKTERNLKFLKALDWKEGIAKCERLFGDIEFVRGNRAEAMAHYVDGLEIARRYGLQREIWRIMLGMSRILIDESKYIQAEAHLTSALDIAGKSQHLIGEVDINNSWAKLYSAQGIISSAKKQAQKALKVAEDTGYLWGKGEALHILGELAIALDEFDTAQERLMSAYTIRQQLRDPQASLTQELLTQLNQSI